VQKSENNRADELKALGWTAEDVRRYASEQGMGEEEALQKGLEEKSKEFLAAGAEVYSKA